MSILERLFGDSSQKKVKEYEGIVERTNELEKDISSLSLDQLKEESKGLKDRIEQGESGRDLMPKAFALVREVANRTLQQRHFDVQVIGGAVLYDGKIAEMRTGEGKTLTATLPIYLNALEGRGMHVITVNDYLARRDTVWMGQIYHALGMSISCITHEGSFMYDPFYQDEKTQESEEDEQRDLVGGFKVVHSYLRPVSRKEAYEADITYGTNNEFGFDYLRDNMVYDMDRRSQRGQPYALIDEIDSVLIDEARTPLVISAPDEQSSQWYGEFARIVPRLNSGTDYEVDEKLKSVTLTDEGIDKVEGILGMGDIYQEKGIKYLHHLEQALRAQVLFERDKDYVVRDGEVVIIDEFTGRMLPGRRFSGGLHQALEAKESISVRPESLTLASITFQNYFRMYDKLAGMTGTAMTNSEEFFKVYGLDVVPIPTNKPTVREDLNDLIFKTEEAKFNAIVNDIKERSEKGQPILVGTVSIHKNEYLGKLLQRAGVRHEILNAKNHEREGEIIAQAGRKGAVTVATNMAGRGVDILLGGNPPDEKQAEEVAELGGLHVIGTERHEARRIDNQLRGRSGRQGDPGSTQFYVSLQDDVVRIFGAERIQGIMEKLNLPEDQPIDSGMVGRAIESAQGKVEGFHFDSRKHLLEYDDVLNKHREVVYGKRFELLERSSKGVEEEGNLRDHLIELVEKYEHTKEEYEAKERELGEERMRQAEKIVVLKTLDTLWMEHLENMNSLRDSVRLRAYGQQDPLTEYKSEARKMYHEFFDNLESMIVNAILNVKAEVQPHRHTHNMSSSAPVASQASSKNKIGRNDPCPCGSGLKYKRCGLIGAAEHKG